MGKQKEDAKHLLRAEERRGNRDTHHPIHTALIQILIPIRQRVIPIQNQIQSLNLNLIPILPVLPVMEGIERKGSQQRERGTNAETKRRMDEGGREEAGMIRDQDSSLNGLVFCLFIRALLFF